MKRKPNTERCPGTGDWAVDDDRWDTTRDHAYFCWGCGRSMKIPQRGHKVGLVPAHRRQKGLEVPVTMEMIKARS